MRESHPGVVELVPGGLLHEGDDPGVVEALQMSGRDSWLPEQAAQGFGERMGGRELPVAVGAEDEETGGRGVGHHVSQELKARLVCPVQVIEHQEHRSLDARHLQEADSGRIQEVALGVGIGALGRRKIPQSLLEGGHQADKLAAMGGDV